jgi:hypothetical protein
MSITIQKATMTSEITTMTNEWTRLALHGTEHHPVLGRVYLNQDYRKTFRAAVPRPDGYYDEVCRPGSRRAICFRSRAAAKAYLTNLHGEP